MKQSLLNLCYVIMKIYFLFTLLFIMENNEKQTKSEQGSGSDWISFLKFAAKNPKYKSYKENEDRC